MSLVSNKGSNCENEDFRKKFLAMSIGNILEWFDFASFGSLADIIGLNFFPNENSSVQLIKTLSVFGSAFLMRPIGGIIMGYIGDKYGRKRALEISILLMLFPSFLIGCLPTYGQAGYISTLLLIVLRLLQGFAAGGELVGAFIYTIESSNGRDKGFWGGSCKASCNLGTSLGIGFSALLRFALTKKQLISWGWRIPFLGGIIFGLGGVLIRNSLKDEKNCHPYDIINETPTYEVILFHFKEIFIVIFTAAFWACSYYTVFIWLPYFMSNDYLIGGKTEANVWVINFLLNIALVILLPIGGMFGDLIGLKIRNLEKGFILALQISLLLMIIVAIPAFLFISTRDQKYMILGQVLLLIPISLFGANLPAFMVSQFEQRLRYSGVGLAYNTSHALFSSTSPILQTSLVMVISNEQSNRIVDLSSYGKIFPAIYLILIAIISYASLSNSSYKVQI